MSIRSRHSRRALEIHRSAIAVARGDLTGVLMIRILWGSIIRSRLAKLAG
ncbi:MAG: hypothetical protein ACRDPD_36245 [Streptosporangiaceae bacterium]